MKKVFHLCLCFLLLLNSVAFSQGAYPPQLIFVTKTNDSVKFKSGYWYNDNMKCDGKKIKFKTIVTDYKSILKNGYGIVPNCAWTIGPVDYDNPNGEQEIRFASVPPMMYSHTAKIAVGIFFRSERPAGLGEKPNTTIIEYEDKPACFEFIKKRIEQSLDSLRIYPVIFYTTRYGPSSNTEAAKSGADFVMEFEFYKSPREGKAEKNNAVVNDFSDLILTIQDTETKVIDNRTGYQYTKSDLYSSEGVRGGNMGVTRFTYNKTWRKFLIDYEKSKPK